MSEQKNEKNEKNEEQENDNNIDDNQISVLEKCYKYMNFIQEKTGIKGIFVILGLVISVVFVYFNIFDSIITNMVGTLYPAFWTIKSLEQNIVEEQKKWLTYWVVFGFFIIVDTRSIVIVKFIPFYFLFKILFLIWLFMPGSNGCTLVYHFIVKKIVRFYEDKIDSYIGGAKDYANDMLADSDLKSFKRKSLSKKVYKNNEKEVLKEDKKENKEHND